MYFDALAEQFQAADKNSNQNLLKRLKFFENIKTIIGEIIGVIGGYLWASSKDWNDPEPIILLAVSGVGLFISVISRIFSKSGNHIKRQKNFTIRTFIEDNQEVSELNGSVELNTKTWQTKVSLPLFKMAPEITLNSPNGQYHQLPEITEVTKNSFTVTIRSSTESGIWNWRAVGQLRK